jgi:hypothetical protein
VRNILNFCLFFAVCGFVGCGGIGGGGSQGFNVGGKVTYSDGSPVFNGDVTFTSGARSYSGSIVNDGSYSVSVPPGTYKIAVTQLVSDSPLDKPSPIDAKYGDPGTSGLVCEVKGHTDFPITVEKPK